MLLRFLSRRYKINKAKRIKFLKRQAEKIDKEKQRTEYNDLKIGKGLQHKEQEKIVGFVKPVGFWSSLLLGEKLTDVFNNSKKISIENSKQFWETVAETQARESIRNKKDK
ncbi:MAG: hypothetical protein LBC92_05410 [Rickettsiales bacterium]|nr:hypothetical protein [Rickettsiales bacterium]